MRIFFILNPKSGPTTFQKQVEKATNYLLKLEHEVTLVETQKRGDATELAQQAAQEGFDVAVAVGGDGTVNEVCNGLANTETALAVLPAGTANVYAADVKIPIWPRSVRMMGSWKQMPNARIRVMMRLRYSLTRGKSSMIAWPWSPFC